MKTPLGLMDEAGHLQAVEQIMLKSGENNYVVESTVAAFSVTLDPNHWYLIESRKKCSQDIKIP